MRRRTLYGTAWDICGPCLQDCWENGREVRRPALPLELRACARNKPGRLAYVSEASRLYIFGLTPRKIKHLNSMIGTRLSRALS